jgi:uncharacterized membrane protein
LTDPDNNTTQISQRAQRSGGSLRYFRNVFLAGIAVLLPISVTAWLFASIWWMLDKPIRKLLIQLGQNTGIEFYEKIAEKVPGLGIFLVLFVIFVVGVLTRSLLGKQLIRLAEWVLDRVPLVRSVYNGLKQLSDAIFASSAKDRFRKAVLVKFMGEDAYAVGFVTGETKGEAQALTPGKLINVFVPTTPNPTSGYLLMVPAEKLIHLHMSVEEAVKLVISAGMITPPIPKGLQVPGGLQTAKASSEAEMSPTSQTGEKHSQ